MENNNENNRLGFGRKDGSQRGWLSGGRGRNKIDICRHPEVKRERNLGLNVKEDNNE